VTDTAISPTAAPAAKPRRRRLLLALGIFGPGLIVMLADGDAGCLITAAQSGAQWGYRLILPQLVLIPILYLVQEMTVRLGVATGEGHAALIRKQFGKPWALASAGAMLVSAVGTLVVEFVAVAGVGELFGLSEWLTVPVATALLVALPFCRGYRRIERIGILIGLAELAFIPAMLLTHPKVSDIVHQLSSQPLTHTSYLTLLAATVGAVIMPYMIFYQQGAVIDRKMTVQSVKRERVDTFLGAIATQVIMIAVIVTMAATVGRTSPGAALGTVGQIATALHGYLGSWQANVIVGAGLLGGALVAAIVASVAGAWAVAEVGGWRHSLNEAPNRANIKFFTSYALTHIAGAALVLASVNLIRLAIDVEVLNALLLPLVLGLLLALEAKALPDHLRMHGAKRLAATTLCGIVMAFGAYMIIPTLGW